MKKYTKLILVAVIALVCLTGCFNKESKGSASDKTVVCSIKEESTGFTINQDMTFVIKNKTIDSVKLYQKIVYDESINITDDLLDTLKEQMEVSFEQFEDVKVTKITRGVEVNINTSAKEMFEYTGTEYSEEEMKNLTQEDINDIISGMEESGYTCKQ